jgi:epoxyqueuosine reductase
MSCFERDLAIIGTENYRVIREFAEARGADLFGACGIKNIEKYLHDSIKDSAGAMKCAVSIGVKLSNSVIENIKDQPTLIYKHHYSTVNHCLDQIALAISKEIQRLGYKALPVPASQIVDWQLQLGHLSHRVVAYESGLGWIGRSTLLVNPELGARVRFATVLTDMPLETNRPMDAACGECESCIQACPAQAITKEGYNKEKCLERLKEFAKIQGIGQFICGVCVKACPVKQDKTFKMI